MKVYARQLNQKSTAGFPISSFHFFQGSYLLRHETMFSLYKFWQSGAFQFGLCYQFLYA